MTQEKVDFSVNGSDIQWDIGGFEIDGSTNTRSDRIHTRDYIAYDYATRVCVDDGLALQIYVYTADDQLYSRVDTWEYSEYDISSLLPDNTYKYKLAVNIGGTCNAKHVTFYGVNIGDRITQMNDLLSDLAYEHADKSDMVKGINHRGYTLRAPENTIPAFVVYCPRLHGQHKKDPW